MIVPTSAKVGIARFYSQKPRRLKRVVRGFCIECTRRALRDELAPVLDKSPRRRQGTTGLGALEAPPTGGANSFACVTSGPLPFDGRGNYVLAPLNRRATAPVLPGDIFGIYEQPLVNGSIT